MATKEQWEAAQLAERQHHLLDFETGFACWKERYGRYFEWIGDGEGRIDVSGKWVVEIGPADFPALAYCNDFQRGVVVEPMPSLLLQRCAKLSDHIYVLERPAEEFILDLYPARSPFVEVWLFNVLQHVMDPDLIIRNAQKYADVIRFFEPLNYGTDVCHLHNFTLEDFRNWFGDEVVKYYPMSPGAGNFHEHECAYGIWKKNSA
jgi:hypothetical protein